MTTSRKLRAVADGEKAKPAPRKRTARKTAPKTVAEAVASGDRRALLVAMQRRVATAIDDPNTLPRDLAQLTRRQFEIAAELAAFDAAAAAARKGGVSRRGKSVVADTAVEAFDPAAI